MLRNRVNVFVLMMMFVPCMTALAAESPLSLEVATIPEARYSKGAMPIKVSLKNISNEPLRILKPFEQRHELRVFFQVQITSEDGQVNARIGGGKIDVTASQLRYATLAKDEKYNLTLDLADLIQDETNLPAGAYTVVLTYSNQYGEDCFKGSVKSNPIRITLGDQ